MILKQVPKMQALLFLPWQMTQTLTYEIQLPYQVILSLQQAEQSRRSLDDLDSLQSLTSVVQVLLPSPTEHVTLSIIYQTQEQ